MAVIFSASAIEIKLPSKPSVHEKNAAVILKKYADKIDKDSKAVFDIAVDKKRIKMHGVFHLTAKLSL